MSMKTKIVWLEPSMAKDWLVTILKQNLETFIPMIQNRSSKTWKQPRDESLRDKNGKASGLATKMKALSIFNLDTEQFQHFNTESTVNSLGLLFGKSFQDSKKRFWLCTRNEWFLIWFVLKRSSKQFVMIHCKRPSIPWHNSSYMLKTPSGKILVGTKITVIAKMDLTTGQFETESVILKNQIRSVSNSIKILTSRKQSTMDRDERRRPKIEWI